MNSIYEGFYARFNTATKKDASVLLGADSLVGDLFEIAFEMDSGSTVAWMKNRFGANVAYFDAETTRHLSILHARNWEIKVLLSFVAFTDTPEPGHYWGEAAIVCYDPAQQEAFREFVSGISVKLIDGVRPEINLGEQGINQIIATNGSWLPKKTIPLPTKIPGTAIIKSRRKVSEKFIEQGRKGNKGCYFVSWLFLLGVVALALFSLKSCGVF